MLHDGKLVSDVATAHTTNIGAREFHSPEAHS
jgi:hypothetical protein